MPAAETIKLHKKSLCIILLYCIINVLTIGSVCSQQKIRIQGTITSIPGNTPISDVNIVCDDVLLTSSDIDGKFTIYASHDAVLKFHHSNYNKIDVTVDGRQEINVTMAERMIEIDEAVVVGKKSDKKIMVTPTSIEIKGNYFHLRTKFRIPRKLLKTDYRFIVQPTIYNVTKKKRSNLRPVVIDGKNYSLIQLRYLNYDKSNDKLNDYIIEDSMIQNGDIYSYADSMYFDRNDIKNDFRSDCYLTLVSYHSPSNYLDSITIAKGTENELRFFRHSLLPMNLDKTLISTGNKARLEITKADSIFIPRDEMKLMSSKGTTKIEFEVNKSSINYQNPINKENIDGIINVLNDVQTDKNATLRSISMIGYSSPEGLHTSNQELANERTKELFKLVTGNIDTRTLQYTTLSSKGEVQPWSQVVDLVEKDKLPIAAKLREIVTKTKDDFSQSQKMIMRLPEYRKIIVPHYLPILRKVEYVIDYSIFRNLTNDEIFELYRQGKELSRYEYFRLITNETDDKSREKIEDDAIKAFPNFTWALNRLAIRTLLQGGSNLEIQKPVLDKDASMTMIYNQTLMALKEGRISMADSLTSRIEEHLEVEHLKAVVNALSGNYKEAYPFIAAQGGINEILLMLALKYNAQAYEKMKTKIDDPKYAKNAEAWYILALCANRMSDLTFAMISMKMALELDPSLSEIAQVDSDLMDIYSLVKPKKEHDE